MVEVSCHTTADAIYIFCWWGRGGVFASYKPLQLCLGFRPILFCNIRGGKMLACYNASLCVSLAELWWNAIQWEAIGGRKGKL